MNLVKKLSDKYSVNPVGTPTETEQAILAAAPDIQGDERARAADALREHGLPSRRVEAWHYTDLRMRLNRFGGLAEAVDAAAAKAFVDSAKPLVDAARLTFVNSRLQEALSDAMPDGVTMTTRAGEGGFADAADAVALLNTLLASEGVELRIADGAKPGKPVELLHGSVLPGASALRHAVQIGKGAAAAIIERHESADDLAVQTNCVTDLAVGDDAEVLWVIVQQEGDDATHLAQLNVTLGARAKLTILVLNANGGQGRTLVRREIHVNVAGEESDLEIRGVNLIGANAHTDVTTVLLHDVPASISNELFRNVAALNGHGVFQGQIRVAQVAQKTDARMACNTLLLSDEAEFSAKPELEIFADDVQCAHGATVTDIEDDHLFYLQARGIPERDARALLVQAFVEEAFEEIGDEALREALNARIEDWLAKNG